MRTLIDSCFYWWCFVRWCNKHFHGRERFLMHRPFFMVPLCINTYTSIGNEEKAIETLVSIMLERVLCLLATLSFSGHSHCLQENMKHLSLLWVSWFLRVAHIHVFQPGPLALELNCMESNAIFRGQSDIECAILMRLNGPYKYAFVVRDGRCYVCRTADAVGRHRPEERLLHGPHNLRGVGELPDRLWVIAPLLLTDFIEYQ